MRSVAFKFELKVPHNVKRFLFLRTRYTIAVHGWGNRHCLKRISYLICGPIRCQGSTRLFPPSASCIFWGQKALQQFIVEKRILFSNPLSSQYIRFSHIKGHIPKIWLILARWQLILFLFNDVLRKWDLYFHVSQCASLPYFSQQIGSLLTE